MDDVIAAGKGAVQPPQGWYSNNGDLLPGSTSRVHPAEPAFRALLAYINTEFQYSGFSTEQAAEYKKVNFDAVNPKLLSSNVISIRNIPPVFNEDIWPVMALTVILREYAIAPPFSRIPEFEQFSNRYHRLIVSD